MGLGPQPRGVSCPCQAQHQPGTCPPGVSGSFLGGSWGPSPVSLAGPPKHPSYLLHPYQTHPSIPGNPPNALKGHSGP